MGHPSQFIRPRATDQWLMLYTAGLQLLVSKNLYGRPGMSIQIFQTRSSRPWTLENSVYVEKLIKITTHCFFSDLLLPINNYEYWVLESTICCKY